MKTHKGRIKFIVLQVLTAVCAINFYACEEVISVDLNSASPKSVIEGTINDQAGPYTVKITKTTDYFNPTANPAVSGAKVAISDDMGMTDYLTEVEPGIYQTDSLKGIPGQTYTMRVEMEGHTYTAQSTMPVPIAIDSITYKLSEGGHMGKTGEKNNKYDLACNFQDIPNYQDFCRIKVIQNGEEINKIFLFSDRLFDGNYIKFSQMRSSGSDYKKGDDVKVELWSIDKATYTYFSTLKDAFASDQGSNARGGQATPANPVSNITGGDVLGYFGAYSVRVDSVKLK